MDRVCSRCKTSKPIEAFSKKISRKNVISYYCRECNADYCKEWYANNKDKAKEVNHKYNEANKILVKERKRLYQERNKDKMREAKKNYYELHREQHKESVRKYDATRRATPRGNLDDRMSRAICLVLNGQKSGRRWEDLVGYTVSDLMGHIEKNFCPGMTWANRDRWHIDHIIPKSAFNYTTAEDIDFKRCWALKNLRPIWATENLIKYTKLERPFQPGLAMGIASAL